jgi:23S rRNA pseudouridine1911/1915/1917 synthase
MTVTIDESGLRVDAALSQALPDLSRSAIQRLLEDGAVTLRGAAVKKNYKTQAGDVFEVTVPEAQPVDIVAQDIPLDVVYEDGDVIVLNKPKGMVVHPAAGHWDGTLVNALLHHCGDSLSGINGELRPGIVHRIDKDTSGLLIVAKNDLAHQGLAAQLKDHSLSRTYWCIVCGNIREDEGTISAPIGRHPADRKKMAVTEKNSRDAVTHFRVLRRYRGYTLVECRLETGRTHQIRVHMAWQNHPILGDTVYGHKKPELGQDSQCLHAIALRFLHPRTGQPVEVTCPLPDYFQQVLDKLTPLESEA